MKAVRMKYQLHYSSKNLFVIHHALIARAPSVKFPLAGTFDSQHASTIP